MPTIVIIGTLDTKGEEFALARRLIEGYGCQVTMLDVGIGEPTHTVPDVAADTVARAAGSSLAVLRAGNDRGAAMATMANGLPSWRATCTPRAASMRSFPSAVPVARQSPQRRCGRCRWAFQN